MSDEIGAGVTPHFAPEPAAPASVIEVSAEEIDDEPIEIVDALEPAEHILETVMMPPPLESGTRTLETLAEAIAALADVDFDAEATDDRERDAERVAPLESGVAPRMPTLMPLARCGATEDTEPAIVPQAHDANAHDAHAHGADAHHDDWATLFGVLVAVASEARSADATETLAQALDRDPIACAWRSILRGESDDFAACGGSTLDEWAADALARFLDMPSRASLLRRDLRARGVAAFGIVCEAA